MIHSTTPLKGISSMATKAVLAQVCAAYEAQTGQVVQIEAVGGVDAAKRVVAGEPFDVVLLASDAIDKLIASGHLIAPRCDWVRSAVALAVPASHAAPDISTDENLKAALIAAPSISYSTGPSGVFLAKLFDSWGIASAMAAKLIVPPPGVPVGSLVAGGQAALGFQQRSELLSVNGITLVGDLQGTAAYVTTFSAGVAAASPRAIESQAFLNFLNTLQTQAIKHRQGMSPVISALPIAIKASEVAPRSKPSNYPAPFAAMVQGRIKRQLGDVFGLSNFGVNLTELPAGARSALRHSHSKQDEFVYILQGQATLVTNAGQQTLNTGDCAGFKANNGDSHQLLNLSSEAVIYLEIGDRSSNDSVTYPDDDLVANLQDGAWQFTHKDNTPH